MPAQKNQHFVPRGALKPFTLDGEGAAINLFNLTRRRAIQNAPTKGQCVRDYLYGKDLRAEQALMKIEGHYARIVTTLSAGGALREEDKGWLLFFIGIQMRRTEHAIEEIRALQKRTDDAVFRYHPKQRPAVTWTDRGLMRLSMRIGIDYYEYAKDLKVVIFKNLTGVDFVTCDHPAVITNRFHLQRLNDNTFCISNSGVILLMPLSPRLCAVCYDGAVYSVANASGTPFVGLIRETDVRAVNEFQYLHAGYNIYFYRWADRNDVAHESAMVTKERSNATPIATVFVRDYEVPSEERYRQGAPDEEATAQELIVAASFQHPRPSSWPSQIQIKRKPIMYSNGSAIGYVRKPEWLVSKKRSA